jgi:hypothetical protein
MRTTLILNDDLVAEAKRRAADQGQSLSSVVNDALRKIFQQAPEKGNTFHFTMPTFRPAGEKQTDTMPADLYELAAAEEQAPYHK